MSSIRKWKKDLRLIQSEHLHLLTLSRFTWKWSDELPAKRQHLFHNFDDPRVTLRTILFRGLIPRASDVWTHFRCLVYIVTFNFYSVLVQIWKVDLFAIRTENYVNQSVICPSNLSVDMSSRFWQLIQVEIAVRTTVFNDDVSSLIRSVGNILESFTWSDHN